jgi:hypothetical protein
VSKNPLRGLRLSAAVDRPLRQDAAHLTLTLIHVKLEVLLDTLALQNLIIPTIIFTVK